MRKNKFFFEHGMHLATLCAVLGLLFFIPANTAKHLGLRIFFGILMALLLIGGGVIVYLAHRSKKARVHYFLYDGRRKVNQSMGALTPDLIQERIDHYLADYTSSVCDLWQDIPKNLRLQLEADAPFRPLIAYRMLIEISKMEETQVLSVFESADNRAVGYLCRSIRDGGDAELADYVFDLKKNFEANRSRVFAFFRKNQRFFEERMLRFVECHMNDFYTDESKI